MKNIKEADALARMWNTFKIDFISDMLADDVEFSSDWVLNPIVGREQLLFFLSNKLKTMKKGFDQGVFMSYSDTVIHPEFENEVFTRLYYKEGKSTQQDVYIRLGVAAGKIKSIQFMALSQSVKNRFSTFIKE